MNIVLLVNKLTDGGAERVASLWATGFCKQGHNVFVILKNCKVPITYLLPPEARLYKYDESPGSKLKFLRVCYKLSWLRRIVIDNNVNVVISIDPDMSLTMFVAIIGKHLPIIHTAHNSFERPKNAPMNIRTKFEKFYRNKLYSYVTVLTQADKDVIGQIINVKILEAKSFSLDGIIIK